MQNAGCCIQGQCCQRCGKPLCCKNTWRPSSRPLSTEKYGSLNCSDTGWPSARQLKSGGDKTAGEEGSGTGYLRGSRFKKRPGNKPCVRLKRPPRWRMMRAMITEIFAVMAPVLACAAIGYGWARSGQRFDTDFISRLVLNIGAPCLMLSVLSSVSIDLHTFKQTALACVLVALLMAGFGAVIPRLLGHDVRAYLPSFVFPNVGNMGLPVCLLAFGQEGLALALAFFMVLSVAHFPAGILLAGGKQAGGLTALLKMPVLYAIV